MAELPADAHLGDKSTFAHGVASGDPRMDRVVIWTRVTGEGEPEVRWKVARDAGLSQVVAEGSSVAGPESDYTVHVDVQGLDADAVYHYRFESSGVRSPVGRTRTLPEHAERIRFAVCSCAKYNAGYFNAYGRIADHEDLNFVLHLGDYIYEVSNRPPKSQTPGANIGRPFFPDHECVTREDYRKRYAYYHLDSDVQRLHRTHPIISTVDDHEFGDGAWRGGTLEHLPERDGPWEERKRAALRARWEWLPLRPPDPADPSRVWQRVGIGDLAEIFLLDTRSRRDEPVGGEQAAASGRTQLGTEQRDWLFQSLRSSKAGWRILANSSVLAQMWDDDIPELSKEALTKLKLINPEGTGPDPDQWDGYPEEQLALIRLLDELKDTLVLSGDVHVALAMDLKVDPDARRQEPASAEFVISSLTSQNLDDKMGWERRSRSLELERAWIESSPNIHWCDLDSHGYLLMDVDRDRARADFMSVDTVLRPSKVETRESRWVLRKGLPGITAE